MSSDAAPRRRGSLLWVVLALGAFAYVAVIDVARLHARGPSLANEELLVLGRHASLDRGRTVHCEADGQRALGELVAMPGELALASSEGVHVPRRATDGFGGTLERLSLQERRVAVEPGRVLIADQLRDEPISMPRKSCLPVLARVSIARVLSGDFGLPKPSSQPDAEPSGDDPLVEGGDAAEGFEEVAQELPAAAAVRRAQAPIAPRQEQSRRGAQTAAPRSPQR